MARPKRNPLAVEDLKLHVTRLAKRKPDTTPGDVRLNFYANRQIKVGEESIRKALEGEVDPTQCQVELLMALLDWYGVTPAELGNFAEHRLAGVIAFAHTFPGPDTPGDLRFGHNRWGMESPACGVAVLDLYRAEKVGASLAPTG